MQPLSQMRPIDAILLDMDGTILNSIKAAERIWAAWAERHGIDVDTFLPTIHGVQSVETIRRTGIAGLDLVAEAARITQAEIDEVEGIEAIPGAAAFLTTLPMKQWGIVTSAPRALALRRIEVAGLPVPPLLIAAEDVARGKPAPDCFHLGAEKLGTTADRCLVIEDSVAGIAAAVSAGAMVLIVTATHHRPTETGHPTVVDYSDLTLTTLPNGSLEIGLTLDSVDAPGGIKWLLQTRSV
ncbi:HAD-IA family hydrolase [Asticcacaulis endophyticus]|uniref:Glycerol-3-phosphatase n=1 Tax=Asticcacaulis endophyticus TaxID=1395890 RepID=A0A918UWA7_9CAUL|nr:HAD-IA family hydrolase [Asticcacaulis endophyticus]GGZ39039.1 glycerol-3-phosphatase [Asticcacaulis endophyticus]